VGNRFYYLVCHCIYHYRELLQAGIQCAGAGMVFFLSDKTSSRLGICIMCSRAGPAAGLSVAAYYFATLRTAIFKKDRQIKKLESERITAAAPMEQTPDFVEPWVTTLSDDVLQSPFHATM